MWYLNVLYGKKTVDVSFLQKSHYKTDLNEPKQSIL